MIEKALENWTTFNDVLTKLREDQVLALLEIEKKGAQRVSFLERLHQRYTTLRAKRERKELINDLLN